MIRFIQWENSKNSKRPQKYLTVYVTSSHPPSSTDNKQICTYRPPSPHLTSYIILVHVIRTRGPEISGKERKAMTSGELMMMTNGCLSIRWVLVSSSSLRRGPEQETLGSSLAAGDSVTPGGGTRVSTEDGPQLFPRLHIFMPKQRTQIQNRISTHQNQCN